MGKKRVREGVNDLSTTHPELVAPLVAAFAKTGWELRPNEVTIDSFEVEIARSLLRLDKMDLRETGLRKSQRVEIARKLILSQLNLRKTHPDIAAELVDQAPATRRTVDSHGKLKWRCQSHGCIWSATISQRLRGTGCKDCAADSK